MTKKQQKWTKKKPQEAAFKSNTMATIYAFKRLEKSIKIGVATQSDEYVPITTPTSKANKNPLMAGPPKINMIKTTTNKIIEVLKVLLKVVFNDLLIIS